MGIRTVIVELTIIINLLLYHIMDDGGTEHSSDQTFVLQIRHFYELQKAIDFGDSSKDFRFPFSF